MKTKNGMKWHRYQMSGEDMKFTPEFLEQWAFLNYARKLKDGEVDDW